MVKVDDVGMLVFYWSVPMCVPMRLRPFPALMFMPMVLIVAVQVLVPRSVVPVLQFTHVLRGPNN